VRAAVVNFDSDKGPLSSAEKAARMVMSAASIKKAALVRVTLESKDRDATVIVECPIRIFLPGVKKLFRYKFLKSRCTMQIEGKL
jgi:hypothetical protein